MEGRSDANINFDDLRNFLIDLGFEERIKGSHHSFRKEGVAEKPNLHRDGSKAKSYQLRQVRAIIMKYGDEIFVAEAPELAGCSAHGKTQVEAVQSVNEAIYLWLETAREFGDTIP